MIAVIAEMKRRIPKHPVLKKHLEELINNGLSEEEAIRKFMEQHNFPFEGTRDYWDEFKGYAEEFEVIREYDRK